MKVTIESTDRIVHVKSNGSYIPARVWEGKTEGGIPVVMLVTRIAAPLDADQAEFNRDLQEQQSPSPMAVEAFPSKLVL